MSREQRVLGLLAVLARTVRPAAVLAELPPLERLDIRDRVHILREATVDALTGGTR